MGHMSAPDTGRGSAPLIVEKGKWVGPPTSRWVADLIVAAPRRLAWRTPAGTVRARPRRHRTEATSVVEVSATTGGWWVATRLPGPRPRWKIDACTPVRIEDGVARFTDLDLDLVIGPGARVRLHDLGQMALRAREWRYPPWLVARALGGLAAALARRLLGWWPFDGSI